MEKIAELFERLFTEALIPAVNKTVSEAIDKAIAERGFSTTTSKYPANLTINQAAELSGFAPRTLYQLNSGKQIPAAFKSGGKLLFRRDEFVSWLRNRK